MVFDYNIDQLPNKPVTLVIQHTVLLGLYGKLFHSYQFSSLVMKIDIRGIISHTTLVGMLYYYITVWIHNMNIEQHLLTNSFWTPSTCTFNMKKGCNTVFDAQINKLGNRYPPVGALAYRRGKARASDLPPQLQCNYQLN